MSRVDYSPPTRHNLISKSLRKIAPGKHTALRKTLAAGIRTARKKQKAGEGPNVRKTLKSHFQKKRLESHIEGKRTEKRRKFLRAYTRSTVHGQAPKKMGFKHLVSAGGRVRSPRKASLLKTQSYTASR